MRVLINGIAGSLGSNVAERLLARGDDILGIDNFATGSAGAVPKQGAMHFVEGSIADAAFVKTQFDAFRPELVVHSAASYKDPDDWQEDITTNVHGTANLVQVSLNTGVKRFINF